LFRRKGKYYFIDGDKSFGIMMRRRVNSLLIRDKKFMLVSKQYHGIVCFRPVAVETEEIIG
jgi:hypothetical protein